MDHYLKNRPKKNIFPLGLQEELKDKAIKKIKSLFLPNEKIIRIVLMGSSVKNTFGKYNPPGFRGSLYSDFDFIIFVEDDYDIPDWLKKEPTAKPFHEDKYNLSYRAKKMIEGKYDIEIFFVYRNTMENPTIKKLAEKSGCEIPFSEKSKWKHIIIYSKEE